MIDNILSNLPIEVTGGLLVAFFGYLINVIIGVFKNFSLSYKYSGFVNTYYAYSYSSTGENEFTTAELSIKKLFGKLHVTAKNGEFTYKGRINFNERNIYIHYKGIEHEEEVIDIFHMPLQKKIKKLWGVSSFISVIGEPTSVLKLITDTKLTKEEVKSEFSKIENLTKGTLIQVPLDKSVFKENMTKTRQEK